MMILIWIGCDYLQFNNIWNELLLWHGQICLQRQHDWCYYTAFDNRAERWVKDWLNKFEN